MHRPIGPQRAATTFLLFGPCIVVSGFLASGLWDVFWTDFMKSNPYRSAIGALFTIPLMYGVLGIFMVIFHYSGALALAGTFAALVARVFGRVPLWALVLIVLLSALAIFVQDALLPEYHFYTDTPEDIAASADTLRQNIRLYALRNPLIFVGLISVKFARQIMRIVTDIP